MRIAICDDDKQFVKTFKSAVVKICEFMKIESVIDTFYNGQDVVNNSDSYQLIFLDIDMPMINGIDVCKKINQNKRRSDMPYVVFVTCKDNLVFDALKQYPYSFIRKSSLDNELRDCIRTINEKLSRGSMYYVIREGRSNIRINLNDVLYIEKVKNYVNYHTDTQVYSERCSMDEKEKALADKGFVRCHAGFILNAKRIMSVEANKVILDNKTDIPVSRKYKDSLQSKYYDWMVERYA